MFPDTRVGIIEPNEDVLMSTSMLQRKEFAASAFDALSSNICVVNRKGMIMAVNRSWRSFALDNSPVSSHRRRVELSRRLRKCFSAGL
jgi:hypothetical protein